MAVSEPVLNTEGAGEAIEYGNGSRAEIVGARFGLEVHDTATAG